MMTDMLISFAVGTTIADFPSEYLQDDISDSMEVEQVSKFDTKAYKQWIKQKLYERMLSSGLFKPEQLEGKSHKELIELDRPSRNLKVSQALQRLTQDDACAICLMHHVNNFGDLAGLNCGHIFCRDCLEQSMQHSDKCPCCRSLIDTECSVLRQSGQTELFEIQ